MKTDTLTVDRVTYILFNARGIVDSYHSTRREIREYIARHGNKPRHWHTLKLAPAKRRAA